MWVILGGSCWVSSRQTIDTVFRMPIYPMLNQRNANPITPNPGLWFVDSCEYSYEYWWEHISYAYLSNVKSHEYWWAEYFACTLDHFRVTTYPLTQSLGGACCFDRPSQGGAWYTPTCPVVIVRSSLDVYKPWWDRAGEIVVWGQIYLCGVCWEIYVPYNKLNKSLNADTNINYEIIHDEIARAKNKCMPSKIVKFKKYKHKKSSWITQGLLKSIRYRDQLYKKLKLSNRQHKYCKQI